MTIIFYINMSLADVALSLSPHKSNTSSISAAFKSTL